MKPATYRAITAIPETDTSITGAQKQAIQRACEGVEPFPHPPSKDRPQFVTPREAAKILNTSKRTIWHLVRIGKLPRIKLGHRSTRHRLVDIANITSVDEKCLERSQHRPQNDAK